MVATMNYRKIVDRHEYETRVSSENKLLMKDFLIEKRAQNKTKATLHQYENNLQILLTYIYRHFDNKSLLQLTRKDIRNISIMFQERGLSSARVNSLLSTLRSALDYFADDDDLEYAFNVGSKVKGLPKNPVREITFLTEEQVYWLRDRLLDLGKTVIAVYLMLSYNSGGRRNEIHQVLKAGLTERYYTNTVIGKRQKKFKLYYDQDTQNLIRQYLNERGDDDIPELFVKCYHNGKKALVNKATFNAWTDYMSNLLSYREGKQIHINPHAFRHTRLEVLSRKGVPLEKLKSLAHHESVATTETYLANRDEEDIAEIFGMDAALFK